MANQGNRRFPALDVVGMFATLTMEHWRDTLEKALKKGSVNKFVAWRYGMQAGLADAAAKGLSTPELDIWVIKRCRDCERCMRQIVVKKYQDHLNKINKFQVKKDPGGYLSKVQKAKRLADKEFQKFLLDSSF